MVEQFGQHYHPCQVITTIILGIITTIIVTITIVIIVKNVQLVQVEDGKSKEDTKQIDQNQN